MQDNVFHLILACCDTTKEIMVWLIEKLEKTKKTWDTFKTLITINLLTEDKKSKGLYIYLSTIKLDFVGYPNSMSNLDNIFVLIGSAILGMIAK